jgi:hypothetical protein
MPRLRGEVDQQTPSPGDSIPGLVRIRHYFTAGAVCSIDKRYCFAFVVFPPRRDRKTITLP